ncbi:MAG TPA: hypothetical protein VEC60_17295 [Reyranella sp.]|nr:hypothetical protein [Reyranella sp.]
MDRRDLARLLSSTVEAPAEEVRGGTRWQWAPHIAPRAFTHLLYHGLFPEAQGEAQARYEPFDTGDRLAYLQEFNGLHAFNGFLSVRGFGPYPAGDMGQPVYLDYGNWVERAPSLDAQDLCVAAMTGSFLSADVVLDRHGRARLVHSGTGEVGAEWPSLREFLTSEVLRLGSLHDRQGRPLVSLHELWPDGAVGWDGPA